MPSVDEEEPPYSGLADDAVDGKGAEAFEAAMKATEGNPLVATGEPFVISMTNIEGDPALTFPDIREGAEAAVELINERLGGVGADYAAGTPGRPIDLRVCSHVIDAAAGQSCANQVVSDSPNLVVNGIDFFSPLFYPVWEGLPVLQELPIFLADFDQPGVFSAIGGCPVTFGGIAKYLVDVRQHDRIAVLWDTNDPGTQCWHDTMDRFYATLLGEPEGDTYRGFPNSDDPADDAANIQAMIDYLDGAAYPVATFSSNSSNCVAQIKGLRAAGYTGDIVVGASCDDISVRDLPESVGVTFEVQQFKAGLPGLSDFQSWEVDLREAAIDSYGPEAPVSAFMNDSFSTILFSWQIANDMLASGSDPFDTAALGTYLANLTEFHIVARPAIDCSTNTDEYESICLKTISFASWDGTNYVGDPLMNGELLDLTDTFNEVAAAYPRATG